MEKPQGYQLRVDVALSGPGFIGGELRFSEHRQTELTSIRDVAELLLQIDGLIRAAEARVK